MRLVLDEVELVQSFLPVLFSLPLLIIVTLLLLPTITAPWGVH
jgi:hypothetical protein